MTHIHYEEAIMMASFFEDAGWITFELEKEIILLSGKFLSCVLAGRPARTEKTSLKDVNENFNNEIQI